MSELVIEHRETSNSTASTRRAQFDEDRPKTGVLIYADLDTDEPLTRDTRVHIPLPFEDALTGLMMTQEIRDNPEALAELERSRVQSERGEVRRLREDDDLLND